MSLSYAFSNLCGAPYERGNISFSPDGSSLAVPCGNRISIYDLRHNNVMTLPFEARQNIKHIVFSPGDPLLLTIDESGRCLLVNYTNGVILNRIHFKGIVSDAKFSPCGKYFALAIDRKLKIWESPIATAGWQFSLRREIRQHLDRIMSIDWSIDSNFILTSSRDLTVKIFSRDPTEGFAPTTFVDHRFPLRAAYFTEDMTRVISISRDGAIISWRWWTPREVSCHEDEEGLKLRNRGFDLTRFRAGGNVSRMKAVALVKGEADTEARETGGQRKRRKTSGEFQDRTLEDSALDSDSFALLSQTSGKPTFVDGKWTLESKVFCNSGHNSRVVKCHYHIHSGLLMIGFSNGILSLYECPSFDALHTLSISGCESPLESICITNDGEWIAAASSQLGQLVVWEWRSETYLLKQQNHKSGIRCVATAPAIDSVSAARGLDGRNNALGLTQKNLIVSTGGEDGKVKLWDAESGFNYMTFTEHIAAVNDIVFTPQGNAVISASSDGSVRAFDLVRYRNFRTFTSTLEGVQFNAVAVDGGGEIVVAGSQGTEYSVLVWSIQTGKLLEKLSGHQAPVTSVQFHSHPSKPGVLVTGSWDGTIRVWDVFGRSRKGGSSEVLINPSGVLSVAFDPRANNQLAAAILSGNIWIWDCEEGRVIGTIDGLRDIHSGRRIGDKFTANNSRAIKKKVKDRGSVGDGVNQNQHFSSIFYSSNGRWILASCHNSPRVCAYDVDKRALLHIFQLTRNLSLDGLLLEHNSKYMNETGYSFQEFNLSDSENDDEQTRTQKRVEQHMALPGAQRGDLKPGRRLSEFHCWDIDCAQNGQHWCAATSHGLFVFSVDLKGALTNAHSSTHIPQGQLDRFAPNILTRNVTPQNIQQALTQHWYSKAMLLSLALNEFSLLNLSYVSIPYKHIPVVVQSIPPFLIPALLNFLRVCLSDVVRRPPASAVSSQLRSTAPIGGSRHLQYHMHWLKCIFKSFHWASVQQLGCHSSTRDDSNGNDKDARNLLAQCGLSASDLRTLCLLLLRNIQRLHVVFSSSFGANLRSLDFILSSKLTS